jgi:hypothetical protein
MSNTSILTKPDEYAVAVKCHNCNTVAEFAIKKGTRVRDYLVENPLCPKCKCDIQPFTFL